MAFPVLFSSCALVDELLAAQAVDSTELSRNEAALFLSVVEDLVGTMTEEQMATAAADESNQHFPGGCAQATAQGNKVTYLLTQCTGRYGLLNVNGTMEVTFKKVPSGMQAHLVAAKLKLNQSVLKVDSTATITFNGSTASLEVASQCEGTGPRGNTATISGSYSLGFNTELQCMTLQGNWSAVVYNTTWTLAITDFQRCGNACPKSGGRVEFAGGIKDVTIMVDFNGTNRASWSSTRGSSGVIQLQCGT
jgi:hypothetical protein